MLRVSEACNGDCWRDSSSKSKDRVHGQSQVVIQEIDGEKMMIFTFQGEKGRIAMNSQLRNTLALYL